MNPNQTEEIDLGYLFKKIGAIFKSCVKALFQVIAFFLKYKYIVLILVIIGVGYGYYKDRNSKPKFNNELLVIPNFESVDYLYNSVEALNARIKEKDSIFLKKILDTNHKKIKKIEIEPVNDIYNYITESRERIDFFRILFQNQDLGEFVDNMVTSKYYKYHKVSIIKSEKQNSEVIIKQLFDYLNNNEHFTGYQEVSNKNIQLQITQHERMINQLDSILQVASLHPTTSSTVYINETNQLHYLAETNQKLMENHLKLLKKQKDQDQIIKVVSAQYNLPLDEIIFPRIVRYPILFVFFFSLIFFVRYAYKKLKRIAESN